MNRVGCCGVDSAGCVRCVSSAIFNLRDVLQPGRDKKSPAYMYGRILVEPVWLAVSSDEGVAIPLEDEVRCFETAGSQHQKLVVSQVYLSSENGVSVMSGQ